MTLPRSPRSPPMSSPSSTRTGSPCPATSRSTRRSCPRCSRSSTTDGGRRTVMLRWLVAIALAGAVVVLPTAQSATVPCVVHTDASGQVLWREPIGCYRLKDDSPYRHAGTDGKDLGADIDAVERATCGVVEGRPCVPVGPTAPAAPTNVRIADP